MKALRCLIVDDEAPAHTLLETFLSVQGGLFTVVGHCYTGLEAHRFLQETEVDVLYLDIEMPHLTGLELLRTLRQQPMVILTTAYSEFAAESYEYEVLDYLLKPITLARFMASVEKIKSRLATSPPATATPALTHLDVRANGRRYHIEPGRIRYIVSKGNFSQLHWDQKPLMVLHTMQALETRLKPTWFCRIHKSYLLNMAHLSSWQTSGVSLIDGTYLPIGRRYAALFEQCWQAYQQEKGLG